MKVFWAMLAALLVAMGIGFGAWKHEQWVAEKNQCLAAIHQAYEARLGSRNYDLDASLRIIREVKSAAASAARDLIRVFQNKTLPLSQQDRNDLAYARKIVAEEEFSETLADFMGKIMFAASLPERERLLREIIALCEKRKILTPERRKRIEIFASNYGAAITPSESPAAATPAPEETRSPAIETVLLVQAVEVKVPYGKTTLPKGTRLRCTFRNNSIVRVRYLDADYDLPITVTDLSPRG